MTPNEIVRTAIPNASDGLVDHILWGRTSFPFTKINAKMLYKSATGFKRATDNKLTLCDMCDNIAITGKYICTKCLTSIRRVNNATD